MATAIKMQEARLRGDPDARIDVAASLNVLLAEAAHNEVLLGRLWAARPTGLLTRARRSRPRRQRTPGASLTSSGPIRPTGCLRGQLPDRSE
jgi:hypothetical protein